MRIIVFSSVILNEVKNPVLYELAKGFSWLKTSVLAINLVIAGYMVKLLIRGRTAAAEVKRA